MLDVPEKLKGYVTFDKYNRLPQYYDTLLEEADADDDDADSFRRHADEVLPL